MVLVLSVCRPGNSGEGRGRRGVILMMVRTNIHNDKGSPKLLPSAKYRVVAIATNE